MGQCVQADEYSRNYWDRFFIDHRLWDNKYREIIGWAQENFSSIFAFDLTRTGVLMYVQNPDDAVMFKLTWG
jgi:hypothetical protein